LNVVFLRTILTYSVDSSDPETVTYRVGRIECCLFSKPRPMLVVRK